MARKAPRKPTHYNKKSSARTKPQSAVPLKYAFDELVANGYEVVPVDEGVKTNKKAKSLVLSWFYKDHPDGNYSNSGRTVQMGLVSGDGEYYDQLLNLPVSEGQLSRDAVKKLRNITGLPLDPSAEPEQDAAAPLVKNTDDDGFDWEDDDDDGVYVIATPASAPRP